MTNRTKYADMNKIMTNSEIHFHNCLCDTAQKMKFSIKNFFMENLMKKFHFFVQCEFRDFTIGRSNYWRSSVKRPVPKNFAKLTEKTLVSGLKPATLVKRGLQHRCFPVNFAKFLQLPGDCF